MSIKLSQNMVPDSSIIAFPMQAIYNFKICHIHCRLEGNPDLCKSSFCNTEKKNKFLLPVIASAASLVIVVVVVALFFVFRKKKASPSSKL